MLINRRHRRMPELNTTSTADISFMLLTFFLVTTSMDSDKGLVRQLAPLPQKQEVEQEVEVGKNDLLNVALDANDQLTCDNKAITLKELKVKVEALAKARPTQHIISVKTDANTSYDAYFQLQNTIVAAYNNLRSRQALKSYGHPLSECTPTERASLSKKFPQRLSEAEPDEEGGGE